MRAPDSGWRERCLDAYHWEMRATLYRRVSKDAAKQQRSIDEQRQDFDDLCILQKWNATETFTDNDRSASRYATKAREDYPRLRQFIADGHTDILVLWESSRGDRELERWAGLLNLCREKNVQIHIISHQRLYDLNNPRDWRTLAEDGVDSAYESEKTRERIMRNVRQNAVKGRPHGKLLYGYTREYDERGNFVAQVIKPDEADVIREITRRVADGEASYSIAQDLNSREITTPRGCKWDLTQIKRFAINPAYNGKRVYRGQVIGDAVWPAIVDDKTFAACVARLTDPRRTTTRDRTLKHLLTGLATCWHCGSPMKLVKNRNTPSYACGGTTKPDQRFCVSIAVSKLDPFITALVIGRLSKPDALDAFGVQDEDQDDSNAAVDELQAQLDGWYDAASAGKVSPAGLARIEAGLLTRIEDAKERATSRATNPLLRKVVKAKDVRAAFWGLTIGQRRELVSLVLKIRVKKSYQGERTLDPARVVTDWRERNAA